MRWPTKLATAAYVLLVLAAVALLALQAQRHSLLVTDLAELLPADAQMGVVERSAQAQSEAALNRQMVMLVGAEQREEAEAGALELAALWRQSGVFATVTERIQPDMAAWRQAAAPVQLALLPAAVAAQWQQQPQAYFRQRAEDMAELKKLDKVAYIRFASVYRNFEDVDAFSRAIKEVSPAARKK